MSETIHRLLMAVGGTLAGVAGLAAGTNLLPPEAMGWIAFAGGVCVLAGNQVRVWWPAKNAPAG